MISFKGRSPERIDILAAYAWERFTRSVPCSPMAHFWHQISYLCYYKLHYPDEGYSSYAAPLTGPPNKSNP